MANADFLEPKREQCWPRVLEGLLPLLMGLKMSAQGRGLFPGLV